MTCERHHSDMLTEGPSPFFSSLLMPENNRPGLLIIASPAQRDGTVLVTAGNDADIEATKRQARSLVSGENPPFFQAWIVDTVFSVTREHDEPEEKNPRK